MQNSYFDVNCYLQIHSNWPPFSFVKKFLFCFVSGFERDRESALAHEQGWESGEEEQREKPTPH